MKRHTFVAAVGALLMGACLWGSLLTHTTARADDGPYPTATTTASSMVSGG
jgi:hypothetical protein